MTRELILHLTEDDYATLMTEAEQTGQAIEALIHTLLDQIRARQMRSTVSPTHAPSKQELLERWYRKGLIDHIPTGRTYSKEEEAEILHLGSLFGEGKPLSEIVIEDRGPY